MDDLIDELVELFYGYNEAKAELKDCQNDYKDNAVYFCQPLSQDVDELKDQIKATIKKIVEINKGE